MLSSKPNTYAIVSSNAWNTYSRLLFTFSRRVVFGDGVFLVILSFVGALLISIE